MSFIIYKHLPLTLTNLLLGFDYTHKVRKAQERNEEKNFDGDKILILILFVIFLSLWFLPILLHLLFSFLISYRVNNMNHYLGVLELKAIQVLRNAANIERFLTDDKKGFKRGKSLMLLTPLGSNTGSFDFPSSQTAAERCIKIKTWNISKR